MDARVIRSGNNAEDGTYIRMVRAQQGGSGHMYPRNAFAGTETAPSVHYIEAGLYELPS